MKPLTRLENFLAKIAGDPDAKMDMEPKTRKEKYLNAIAQNGGGSGGSGDSGMAYVYADTLQFTGGLYVYKDAALTTHFTDKNDVESFIGNKPVCVIDSDGTIMTKQFPLYMFADESEGAIAIPTVVEKTVTATVLHFYPVNEGDNPGIK